MSRSESEGEEIKNSHEEEKLPELSHLGASCNNNEEKLIDYYFALDSGHKDFIRSMVQLNDNTVITASEDKTIKIFTIGF